MKTVLKHITQKWLGKLSEDRQLISFVPFGWLFLFFIIPFMIIVKISFSEAILSIPPFQPMFHWLDSQQLHFQAFFQSYFRLFTDLFYVKALINSVYLAALATFFCLIIGYPMAYAISRAPLRWQNTLLLLIILPFWTSYLIRVYAWIGLLNPQGVINQALMYLGITQAPLPLIYNKAAILVGLVYCYLPFMILPIYATLQKINPVYIEASYDLGCRPWASFWRIIVPLSLPGVISGGILVFIPAVGEYVIPELLGGSDSLMLGRVIWMEFFNNRDWPMACAVAVIMLIILVVPVMFIQRLQSRFASEGQTR